MKFSSNDFYNGVCTPEQYYSQFETARDLKIGGVYVNNKGSWDETEYTIVYIGHGVALGVESVGGIVGSKYSGINASPKKCLFHSSGNISGWKLNDSRACYRLRVK